MSLLLRLMNAIVLPLTVKYNARIRNEEELKSKHTISNNSRIVLIYNRSQQLYLYNTYISSGSLAGF